MQENMETFNDLIIKLKRLETTLSSKIDRFVESEKALSDLKKELTLETEEIKRLQNSLPEVVKSAIEDNIENEFSELLPSLVESFKEETLDFIDSSVKKVERLNTLINDSIAEMHSAMSIAKQVVTLRSIGMSFVFSISSLVTAFFIFYFFPQSQHVHYDLNPDTARYISYGIAYSESFSELTQKDKDLIMKRATERLHKHNL